MGMFRHFAHPAETKRPSKMPGRVDTREDQTATPVSGGSGSASPPDPPLTKARTASPERVMEREQSLVSLQECLFST